MKHPALARVFAVVLAVLGVSSIWRGIVGLQKNKAEQAERLAYEEKLSGRIENYERLHAELENAADYEQARTALRRVLEEHEKAAAKHKTDTAIMTAAKGGLRMGEEMIASAQAQINELRQQLKDANARKELLTGLLAELIASNRSRIPCLDAMVNAATGFAIDSSIEGAKLTVIIAELRNTMDAEPSPYDYAAPDYLLPEMPVMPELPQYNVTVGPYEDIQAAYDRATAQYQRDLAAYDEALAQYARDLNTYYDTLSQYEMERLTRTGEQAMLGIYSEEYKQQHAQWEMYCKEIKKQANFAFPAREIRRLSAALASLVRQANATAAAIAAETGGFYPGLEELSTLAESVAARLEQYSGLNLASLSNEEFLQLAEAAEEVLNLLRDAFLVVGDKLNNPAAMIADLMEKLHLTELAAQAADVLLARAEHEIQAALEELWYQFGEQEKKEIELEAEKLGLDSEAKILAKNTLETEELKELTNKHSSARLLLTNVPAVKNGMEQGMDLPASARAHLDAHRQESARLFGGKRLVGLLSVVGGVMALLGIPAAYELIKSRFLLVAPVLLCLAFTAGAFGLNEYMGFKRIYAVLFTALFAVLQLLIVAPRSRQAKRAPQHLKV